MDDATTLMTEMEMWADQLAQFMIDLMRNRIYYDSGGVIGWEKAEEQAEIAREMWKMRQSATTQANFDELEKRMRNHRGRLDAICDRLTALEARVNSPDRTKPPERF